MLFRSVGGDIFDFHRDESAEVAGRDVDELGDDIEVAVHSDGHAGTKIGGFHGGCSRVGSMRTRA